MHLPFCEFTYLPLPLDASDAASSSTSTSISAMHGPARAAIAPTKKRRRKRLHYGKTLQRYAARIRGSPTLLAALSELDEVYLSTFEVFSTEATLRETYSNNAFVLMEIARERGVRVKAVTSECKVHGTYRATLLPGDCRKTAKIVYVGNYNYFTSHEETKWAVLAEDRVYHPLQ